MVIIHNIIGSLLLLEDFNSKITMWDFPAMDARRSVLMDNEFGFLAIKLRMSTYV